MYGYGREVATKIRSGKKAKTGKVINVQPAAEMRHEYRHYGSSAAVSGRKPNPVIQTQAIINANDDGAIYHATPRPNKRKKNNLHSLANSVAENKPSVTEH